MITAVVYTSNTGETEKYAKAFAEMVHPSFTLDGSLRITYRAMKSTTAIPYSMRLWSGNEYGGNKR